MSRLVGRLADVPIPRPLRRPVLGAFAAAVGIDLAEAEGELRDYPCLDAFFVRRLRPGLRPMPSDPHTVVSPVDGRLGQIGEVAEGRAIQAKGLRYSVAELLGDPAEAAGFEGGWFATIYLSPRDYHRIHAPVSGAVTWARHEPGALMPVNPPAVTLVPDLFARNERLACRLASAAGAVAVVAVAAINVGRISAAFDPAWNGPRGGVTNRRGAGPESRRYEPPPRVERGAELMAFHLGSTVVLLGQGNGPALRPDLEPGAVVRLGQPLT